MRKITFKANGQHVVWHVPTRVKSVSIFRERKVTKAERRRDRGAKVMAAVVNIEFHEIKEPQVVVNRDLCE